MDFDLDTEPIALRAMYRRLTMLGFTPYEAGNLVAKLVGLEITENGWKLDQIIRVLFLTKITIAS